MDIRHKEQFDAKIFRNKFQMNERRDETKIKLRKWKSFHVRYPLDDQRVSQRSNNDDHKKLMRRDNNSIPSDSLQPKLFQKFSKLS